jgi:DNA repair exonuclease SbcCD nuclease subunit
VAIESKYQDNDHPIGLDAAEVRGLDYLALGHWHSKLILDGDRMAYPGTPEPTSFGETDSGNVLLVRIDTAGQKPQIETRTVSRLRWVDRVEQMSEPFEDAVRRVRADLEGLPEHQRTLLRLTLQGALEAESLARLGELEAWLQAAGLVRFQVRPQVHCREEMHGALQRLAERDEVVAGTAADLRRLATLDNPEIAVASEVQPRPVEDLLGVWQARYQAKDGSTELGEDLTREQVAEEALLVLSGFAQEVDR